MYSVVFMFICFQLTIEEHGTFILAGLRTADGTRCQVNVSLIDVLSVCSFKYSLVA